MFYFVEYVKCKYNATNIWIVEISNTHLHKHYKRFCVVELNNTARNCILQQFPTIFSNMLPYIFARCQSVFYNLGVIGSIFVA